MGVHRLKEQERLQKEIEQLNMDGGFIFGWIGIEQYNQTFWLQNVSQKPSPCPEAREPPTSLYSILIEP